MAPYSDQPNQRGLLFMSDSEMEGKIETVLKAGYQVNIHAIGDAAIGKERIMHPFFYIVPALSDSALLDRMFA